MIKRILCLILTIFITASMFAITVNADLFYTLTVTTNATENIANGDIVVATVTLNTTEALSGYQFTLQFDPEAFEVDTVRDGFINEEWAASFDLLKGWNVPKNNSLFANSVTGRVSTVAYSDPQYSDIPAEDAVSDVALMGVNLIVKNAEKAKGSVVTVLKDDTLVFSINKTDKAKPSVVYAVIPGGNGVVKEPVYIPVPSATPVIPENTKDKAGNFIQRANICIDNAEYKYMRDAFINPATLYANGQPDIQGLIDDFTVANYYEALLMNLITKDTFVENVISEMMTVSDVTSQNLYITALADQQLAAIDVIKSNTSIADLKTACDTVAKAVEKSRDSAMDSLIKTGVYTDSSKAYISLSESHWKQLTVISPKAKSVQNIVAPAHFSANADITLVNVIAQMDEMVKKEVVKAEKAFADKPTKATALKFTAVVNLYNSLCKYSCTVMKSYLSRFDSVGDTIAAVGWFEKAIGSWNFYNPDCEDVEKVLSIVVSEEPSDWAVEYDEKAQNYGFLPENMQNNYQSNITRAEFCKLLYHMMEKKDNVKFTELINATNKTMTSEFDDVLYYYVTKVAKLGIVNGVGDNKFDPLGEITRQQAAKILCIAAEVMGYDVSAPTTNIDGVDDWAIEGVNFVVDRGIMIGTDNGFEPHGTYTKEQAITTMVRFFEYLK